MERFMDTPSITPIILSLVFNVLVGIGLPVSLILLIRKKTKMRIGVLFIGACAYIATNIFLLSIVDTGLYLIKPLAAYFETHVLQRCIFFALVDGAIQLGGYYLIILQFMKDFKRKENALMYGVGIRLIDSVMAYGLNSLWSILVILTGINSSVKEDFYKELKNLSGMELFGTGLIGLFLMVMMIAVSVLIFLAAKRENKKYLLPTAYAVFVLNFLLLSLYSGEILTNIFVCVLLLGLLSAAAAVLSYFVYRADTDDERGKSDIVVDKKAERAQAAANTTSMKERIARVSRVNDNNDKEA